MQTGLKIRKCSWEWLLSTFPTSFLSFLPQREGVRPEVQVDVVKERYKGEKRKRRQEGKGRRQKRKRGRV